MLLFQSFLKISNSDSQVQSYERNLGLTDPFGWMTGFQSAPVNGSVSTVKVDSIRSEELVYDDSFITSEDIRSLLHPQIRDLKCSRPIPLGLSGCRLLCLGLWCPPSRLHLIDVGSCPSSLAHTFICSALVGNDGHVVAIDPQSSNIEVS